jgi:hypothetical protein
MGIELYPKFLSLAEPRCYLSLRESIVAKCCQKLVLTCPLSAKKLDFAQLASPVHDRCMFRFEPIRLGDVRGLVPHFPI